MEKIKAIDPKIIVNSNVDKPCYSIEYYDTADNEWHIGYSSFDLQNVIEWLNTAFDVVKSEVVPIVRCKECKYLLRNYPERGMLSCGYYPFARRRTFLDDFCNHGKKGN